MTPALYLTDPVQRPLLSPGRSPQTDDAGDLAGLRILVVEDEFLVAMLVEDALAKAGCTTVGPVPSLEEAMQAARTADIDGAVLDINLGGERVYPAADALGQRGIPFVFTTGYGFADLPERFRSLPRVVKPFDAGALTEALRRLMAD